MKNKTNQKDNPALSVKDHLELVKHSNELPDYVKEGIKRGQEQARHGLTKSTDDVMKKY